MLLKTRDVEVICANGEPLFDDADEMRRAMGQVGMVFSELEKTRLVKKLRSARDRRSRELGFRVEGRARRYPDEVVAAAKKLHRKNPKTGQRRSLRQIAAELVKIGYVQPASGKAYNPNSVKQMLERKR